MIGCRKRRRLKRSIGLHVECCNDGITSKSAMSCRANMSPNFLQILILLFIVSSFLFALSMEPRSLLSCLGGCSLLMRTLRRRCLPSCLWSPRVYGCHSVMCHRTRSYSSLDTLTLNNLLPIHLLSEAPHLFYRTYMHICTAMTFSYVYMPLPSLSVLTSWKNTGA